MGKSKLIEQQQKANEEFQKYINAMTQDMAQRQNFLSDQLEKMEEEHYTGFSDKALLMEGRYSHLTTVDEWSLKSVNMIIESCSKALFGDKKEAPEGSSQPQTDDKTSDSIKAMKSREVYIISEAFDVVQTIVGSFNSTTSTNVEQKIDAKPIAPGMTMFIGVENNAFSSKNFLKSQKIIQTLFVFKVCYSIDEGKKQSALSDLELYEDQKERFRKIIQALGEKEMELDLDDPDYDEKFNKLEDRADLMSRRMDAITKRLSELNALKLEQEREECRQIVMRMHTRRDALTCVQNGGHQRTSSGFTCTESKCTIRDRIQRYTPKFACLVSVNQTDCVGNHYKAVFASKDSLTKEQVDSWIASALNECGNFHFD